MERNALLLTIAETGYNVGFGAKKTFATFDIVSKVPGWIGFISFAIGTFALFTESLSAKTPSAILLIAGVGALYFATYPTKEYELTGNKLISIHNKLRNLYRVVQTGGDLELAMVELGNLEKEFYSISIGKQIFLSDWYAHFKFFAQSQVGWMNEQLHFTWKDKVPLSARLAAVTLIVFALAIGLMQVPRVAACLQL